MPSELTEEDVEGLRKALEYQESTLRCQSCGSRDLERKSRAVWACRRCGGEVIYGGFNYIDLGVPYYVLTKLARVGLVTPLWKSRSGPTDYVIEDEERARRALSAAESEEEEEEGEVPRDLFSVIEGYDNVKELLLKALSADKPVHFLLIGPPATAKSLFLEELSRIPGSAFVVAGTATGPGIRDLLLERRPSILIIDELDKVRSTQDLSVLLTLMEKQVLYVTTVKRGRQQVPMRCMVFAAANREDKMPPELLSRFMRLHFKPYTDDELRRVMVKVLTEREGVDRALAERIADLLISQGFRDPRDAVRVARLASSPEEAEKVIETMKQYRKAR